MACLRRPMPTPNCPGPVHPAPVPDNRCGVCQRAVADVANVRARRGSIANLLGAPGVNASTLQGGWTDRAAAIVEDMYGDYFVNHAGGAAPCNFSFCWGGSGARREACPYSDVDAFIVLENGAGAAEKQVFNQASTEVKNRLQAMLEHEQANVPGPERKGFTFCVGGLNPLAHSQVIGGPIIPQGLTGTAVELAGIVEDNLNSPNEFVQHCVAGLSDCGHAFGTEQLFRDFKREVDLVLGQTCSMWSWRPFLTYRRRMALKKIQEVAEGADYVPPQPADTRFHIKKQFYRLPQFVAQALSWWHDIGGVTTDEQITNLVNAGKLSARNAARLRMGMEAPLIVRIRSHLHANREVEWVRTANHPGPNPDNELVLDANQEFRLRRAAQELVEVRRLAGRFHTIKTKAFGHRRSPFYDR